MGSTISPARAKSPLKAAGAPAQGVTVRFARWTALPADLLSGRKVAAAGGLKQFNPWARSVVSDPRRRAPDTSRAAEPSYHFPQLAPA